MNKSYLVCIADQSLGLQDSYIKPTHDELLEEYLKIVPFVTINENKLSDDSHNSSSSNINHINNENESISEIRIKAKEEKISTGIRKITTPAATTTTTISSSNMLLSSSTYQPGHIPSELLWMDAKLYFSMKKSRQ
jgi:hypothetical protein